jgi:hypothetical protein
MGPRYIPGGKRDFPGLQNVQTDPAAETAGFLMGTGVPPPGIKWPSCASSY